MLHPSHNPALVVISVVVACIASYAALQLAGRIVAAGRIRVPWLLGSAFTMGVGIWSMHFVAMLAFRVELPVAYAIDLLILSALVAIAASLLAFMIVSRPAPRATTLLVAGLFMGPAIAGMHYIGMAAMRMPAVIQYDRGLVTLSVAIAVTASLAALRLFVEFRDDWVSRPIWLKPASAVLMGAAISGMHYTGMRAAHFVPLASGAGRPRAHRHGRARLLGRLLRDVHCRHRARRGRARPLRPGQARRNDCDPSERRGPASEPGTAPVRAGRGAHADVGAGPPAWSDCSHR